MTCSSLDNVIIERSRHINTVLIPFTRHAGDRFSVHRSPLDRDQAKQTVLFRAVIHNSWIDTADIPANTGYRHLYAIFSGVGFINRLIHPGECRLIIMTPHDDLPVNKPTFFTRSPTPDAHFVAIEL